MSPQPLAYLDPSFLESEEGRPIRILAEYLEPLRRFRRERIQDTVVFFGSARIHSREAAELELRQPLAVGGSDDVAARRRREKAVVWSRYYEEARELAKLLTTWTQTLESPHMRFVVTS